MLSIDARILPSVLVAAILITVPLSGCVGRPDDGSDENVEWKGGYRVGDFVEYYLNSTLSSHSQFKVLRMTVIGETDTEIMVNQTVTSLHNHNHTGYEERSLLMNATLAFDIYFDPTDPIPNSTFTYLGREVLSTRWGARTCSHYNGTWHPATETTVTLEFWLYKGVLMKAVDHSLVVLDSDSPPIESGNAFLLKDTNLAEITDQ